MLRSESCFLICFRASFSMCSLRVWIANCSISLLRPGCGSWIRPWNQPSWITSIYRATPAAWKTTPATLQYTQSNMQPTTIMNITMLMMVLTIHPSIGSIAPVVNCQCSAFEEAKPEGKPIVVHGIALNLECDDAGRNICKNECVEFAKATIDIAPRYLCLTFLKNVTNLKPAVFSKVCTDEQWVYTGLTASNPMCCINSKQVPCEGLN